MRLRLLLILGLLGDEWDESGWGPEEDFGTPPETPTASAEAVAFTAPKPPREAFFADPFPDTSGIGSKWILSEAKKDGVEDTIAKYNGVWKIGAPEKVYLKGDNLLILTTKARHAAISAKLERPFNFAASRPFVVQYDVKFQNGQECGGAYIKLLEKNPQLDLKQYTDKTPYSIMFGPDKCGLTTKLHTIIRFRNPVNGTTNEHHAKQPESSSLDEYITDGKSHVYRLEIHPDGHYRVLVDMKEKYAGDLHQGDGLSPPIPQPAEIPDPGEKKPSDWDEREKIPDPEATKPDDWDEDAPEQIPDESATRPSDWLEAEEPLIPDPSAEKPEDWDNEMDGEWEPPRISNPKCEGISGCGKWERPMIRNPAYKGKWRAPLIPNPSYQGKWKPPLIKNPSYFEPTDLFKKLTPIGAVGLELWTMSEGIAFDNFLVTDDVGLADAWTDATWAPKRDQEARQLSKSFFGGLISATEERPWLWAVYLLVVLIPLILITVCCFPSKKSKDLAAEAKKTDAPQPDDDDEEDGKEAPELQPLTKEPPKSSPTRPAKGPANNREDLEKLQDEEESEDEEEEEEKEEEEESESPKPSPKSSPKKRNLRQRKAD